ncbi:MAG: Crp/Fnr family transcriptional regulator [Rikenellaceae bacterium]|jgi:CRP-like cAMP-binding protein|nr:Crp/Fnr family transcriptional regulator [Rikenellaceae bacterium]
MYTILTECPLFRGLTAAQIENALASPDNYAVTDYAKGDLIARRDTAYSGLMILLTGTATGEMAYPDGRTVKIDMIEAPQLIAPAFLFGGYNRLPVDVIAQSDVQILTLHRGFVFELMQDNVLVLSNFIDIISNRAGAWSKKIYLLSFRSLKAKLASYLLDNSSAEQPLLAMPDAAQVADYFAATRSSIEAVVADLEKKGIIKADGDNIFILNRKALQEIIQ